MQYNDESELPMMWELHQQTDRGAAVIAVGWLEVELESAISVRLRDDKSELKKLLGTSGAVGTYNAKVSLGYLLGLYSKATKQDFDVMGRIRNKFAHRTAPYTFEYDDVRSACEAIEIWDRTWARHPHVGRRPRPFDGPTARLHFVQCASVAATTLRQMSTNAVPQEAVDWIW